MKNLKLTYTGLATIALFASCATVHKIPVPVGTNNAIEISAKQLPLTENEKQTWGHKDLATDTIPGMSIAKAYEFLKGKKATEIIVAVNDSGIDLDHEDLKNILWTNEKEIAGNGKDDDKNGYIDDVHGWNFLGDVYDENLEITRLIKIGLKKFDGKIAAEIPENELKEYEDFLKLKKEFDPKLDEAAQNKTQIELYYNVYAKVHSAMVKATGKEKYTIEDVQDIQSQDELIGRQKELTQKVMSSGTSFPDLMEEMKEGLDHYTSQVDANYNLDFHPRREILKDNEFDMSITNYGDGNPDDHEEGELHGTHVAGIILAENSNHKGVDGVATNVKLMAVRCVPNGDEYDKDIALAFRYAVDNGAKVINTSFGKGYSPNAEWVYEAIKYAEKHDVLIVNAAGNDAENIDEKPSFPSDAPDSKVEISDNMITVGAMSSNYNENMLAEFSNYGKINVDVFAPGVDIYATVPDNKYKYLSGTSMASPSTAGVAAMIRSYYPELSAKQVKYILMNSGTLVDIKVLKPGTADLVSLADLCVSGRIVNAYNAVKMADQMVSKK